MYISCHLRVVIREMHVLKLFKIGMQTTCWCVTQLHQTNKNQFHPEHYHTVIEFKKHISPPPCHPQVLFNPLK